MITFSICPSSFFFFNDTATTEIYTLSLHDALPISLFDPSGAQTFTGGAVGPAITQPLSPPPDATNGAVMTTDRKSTRLNSSHSQISYAVFCLKKKKKNKNTQ